MPIPNRRDDLQSFGYSFSNLSRCRGCNAEIEWWSTPAGNKMPFTVTRADGVDVLIPHWSNCPKADQFRKKT